MRTFTTKFLTRSAALFAGCIFVNIALGYLVRTTVQLPVYLDSIGTILVGALLGPLAGASAGALTNVVWALLLDDPSVLPYAITAAFIGWAAGYAVLRGAFEHLRTVVLSGLLVGLGAALISAPITAYVHGGTTGAATDELTEYLVSTGSNLLQAATLQSFISEPLDKTISFVIAWLAWRALRLYFQPASQRGSRLLESLEGYSVAVLASLLALLLSFVFLPALGRGMFSVFYLAVLLSAWRGGLGPALLTTAVGAFAGLLLLVSPYFDVGIDAEDWLRVSVFVIVSLAIAVIADQLEKSKRDLQTALQAEREGRARLSAIADGVDEALVLLSPDQTFLDVNRRFEELFDISRESIVGLSLADSAHLFAQVFADEAAPFEAIADDADAAPQNKEIVTQGWPQDRELELFTVPIHDRDGYMGRLFVFRDVTHEREVDRMKTEFVSLVSHELRTPLTSIQGFTELVLDGDAGEINEEVEEYLGIVYNNAERLVALVNDLLDISRIESGRIQLELETVHLTEIVQTVSATMGQVIDDKQQTLTTGIDPNGVTVVGDKAKLVQVLTNYVSNAYKYTQPGGTIHIDISRQGDQSRVAVIDNGHGISPKDQERLFTRFYRVDNAMTHEVGGTGLGLSIVKKVIELMGGEVGVISALDEGSTFYFTVPLASAGARTPSESP